jgi:predicted RNase H-like HicB family nuclease
MRRYIHLLSGLDVVVEKDPLADYFATVPALPGCGSQGDSVNDTLTNLNDAIMTVLHVIGEDDPNRLQRLISGMTTCEAANFSNADTTGAFNAIIPGGYLEEATA